MQTKTQVDLKQWFAIENGESFLIVGLEDNFQWTETEITKVIFNHNNSTCIEKIAELVGRPVHEIKYLITYFEAKCRHDRQPLYRKYKKLIK